MASGQIFVMVACPPATAFALEDIYNGTSTGGVNGGDESVPVWTFNAATSETMDFYGRLAGYGAGGLTLTGSWVCTTTATVNTANWRAAFRRVNADNEDLTLSQAYDFNLATDDQALIGRVSDFSITFTNGADMDSVANNDAFIMRFQRLATATGDTTTSNAYLLQGAITLKET